ncbi:unnamed protein product [Protopolystoma xenopodis]|uniref:Uncharacterized protein n=1 Tax=Protopolystoma xenopodis TaxID=117903 RepID=A0A448WCG6_9PLAT|nr:unnamed protein product [Protopolystoma xenopodis]
MHTSKENFVLLSKCEHLCGLSYRVNLAGVELRYLPVSACHRSGPYSSSVCPIFSVDGSKCAFRSISDGPPSPASSASSSKMARLILLDGAITTTFILPTPYALSQTFSRPHLISTGVFRPWHLHYAHFAFNSTASSPCPFAVDLNSPTFQPFSLGLLDSARSAFHSYLPHFFSGPASAANTPLARSERR